MKNKSHILIPFLAVLMASCSDFLEPKSENEFVPDSAVSLDEMLMYEVYNGTNGALSPFFTLMSDDGAVVPFSSSEGDLVGGVKLSGIQAVYTWQPEVCKILDEARVNETIYDIYSACYKRILGCNAALDYLPKVEGEEMDKIRIQAEARVLRAFYYFHLVNCYGLPYTFDKSSAGVPLHLVSKVSSEGIQRNTVEEVYDQVLSDLLTAEELYGQLPEKLKWKENGRVSEPMLQLFLSRVYLYMENWEKASEYARKVMDNPNFRLLKYQEMPSPDQDLLYELHTYKNPEVIWPYGNVSDIQPFESPYMLNFALGGTASFVVASSDLLYAYHHHGDIRRTQYLVRDRRTDAYKAFGKIAIDPNNHNIDTKGKFARSFRLAEAYLNYAEAEAKLSSSTGDEHFTAAYTAIEALRSSRIKKEYGQEDIMDDIKTANTDEFIQSIREERRLELCFEDHRWFDLRRYGMPEIHHIWYDSPDRSRPMLYTLQKNDPHYVLQIPTNVMTMNKSLQQNPKGPERIGQLPDQA